jgi:predicted regulator of Ras-like GTPase activity (Roadblock/LC7/MglB family)
LNYQELEQELIRLAKTPGIIACALVAIDTGMIYLSSSNKSQFEIIAEGARDYWVLHQKNGSVFGTLGSVNSIIVRHEQGLLSIRDCGQAMLLITIAKMKEVNWREWSVQVQQLCQQVKELETEK